MCRSPLSEEEDSHDDRTRQAGPATGATDVGGRRALVERGLAAGAVVLEHRRAELERGSGYDDGAASALWAGHVLRGPGRVARAERSGLCSRTGLDAPAAGPVLRRSARGASGGGHPADGG